MPLTVGVDSYIDLAGAQVYFAGRLYTEAWDSATDTTKEKALRQATREIDRQPFIGRKADASQALEFPRCYITDPRAPGYNTEHTFQILTGEYCEADVPQAVKDAVCEQALYLLTRGDDHRGRLQAQGVRQASIGGVSETYDRSGLPRLCPEARALLLPHLAGAVAIT